MKFLKAIWHTLWHSPRSLKTPKQFNQLTEQERDLLKQSINERAKKKGRDLLLPAELKQSDTSDLATSLLVGQMTHHPIMGMMIGGDPTGALLGATIADDTLPYVPPMIDTYYNSTSSCESSSDSSFSDSSSLDCGSSDTSSSDCGSCSCD